MKFKKFFTAFALSGFLMAGALVGVGAAKEAKVAKAENVGEIIVNEARNSISTSKHIYLLPTQNYDISDSWDNQFVASAEDEGVFFNGVKQDARLHYVNVGQPFKVIHYEVPRDAVEGDLVEFKGTFTCAAIDKSFTIHYATQRFAGAWLHALEDYDVVSLKDANMPDLENYTTNTDELPGYNYVTDPAGLPKQKGFFGLTNNTGSYAFQFYYQKTTSGTGWFDTLIGGSGPLYSSGHFIAFKILDDWNYNTGHGQVIEYLGTGDNWVGNPVWEWDPFELGWNFGEKNLIEFGAIKVRDIAETHLLFFKVNGQLKWSTYWELETAGMTTKVCMINPGAGATVSNSIEPSSTSLTAKMYAAAAKQLSFNMGDDICPAVNNWADYFIPVDSTNLQFNGDNAADGFWNFFKKTGEKEMFLALGDLGLAPVAGDILYIGGMFKAAREVSGVKTLFKVNFEEAYFQYDGEAWNSVDPSYTAEQFAKDVLKQTLSVCSAGTDNHDALVLIWADLAEAYETLIIAQKALLVAALPDTQDAPTTIEAIDALDEEDSLAFGMGRYDYCTAKYSLTNFITGRTPSAANPSVRPFELVADNSTTILVIVLSVAALVVAGGFIILRRRKEDR